MTRDLVAHMASEKRGSAAASFPRVPDLTVAFLREGYEAISRRCRQLGTDAFATRLAGVPVVCMRGEAAARLFYGGGNFTRRGALPPNVQLLLQGKGSVQALDGEAHRWRKRMFLELLGAERVRALGDRVEACWRAAIPGWSRAGRIVLHDEVRGVLTRAVLDWAGLPGGEDVAARTRELAAMVDQAGSLGPGALVGLYLRRRADRWARSLVGRVRSGQVPVADGTPLHVVATHRDEEGTLLSLPAAGNELLNLLRPVVAVSRFLVFAALALHEHPSSRDALRDGDDAAFERFAQEVRRLYPFFPAVPGRALRPLDLAGRRIEEGALVLFDLYGTNHDERLWLDPRAFRPERFVERPPGAFDLVPQGAGDPATDHRCPGDPVSIELVKRVTRLLLGSIDYAVPKQDLRVRLSRLPALPESGVILADVQPAARGGGARSLQRA